MFLFGVNLLKKKQVFIELLKIYGIGLSRSCFVCDQLGFGKNIKVKGLSRQQIFSLKDFLLTIYSLDVERKLVDVLKNIGSYRGQRHTRQLPVRGQRTRSNHRTSRRLNK
jgi:small subunit ribosomal protein S13